MKIFFILFKHPDRQLVRQKDIFAHKKTTRRRRRITTTKERALAISNSHIKQLQFISLLTLEAKNKIKKK